MDEINKEIPQEPPVVNLEATSAADTSGSEVAESTVNQPTSAQQVGESVEKQQPAFQQPQQPQQLQPGYIIDPATGQAVFVGYQHPNQPGYVQSTVMYSPQQPTSEQIAAQQALDQQRYGVIMQSVESFVEGEATVSDVVKTLYANTAQDDQLWKGLLVGAAATVLLTSGPVREAMGKTFGTVFPGLKESTKAKMETSESVVSQSSPEKE